jgi:hypothetical protein
MRPTPLWQLGLILVVATSSASAQSDSVRTPATRASIQRLLVATQSEAFYVQMSDMMMMRYASSPVFAPYAEVMRAFLQKHASFAAMEDDLIKLYSEAYSEEDVVALVAFYETPLGQRVITATPTISAKAAAMVTERMNALMPQLLKDLGLPPPG